MKCSPNFVSTILHIAAPLFIITIVASIPAAFVLYAPVLDDPNYIVGASADTGVALGVLLEFIVVIANIGTAVVLFPIVKRMKSSPLDTSPLVSLSVPSSWSASSAS